MKRNMPSFHAYCRLTEPLRGDDFDDVTIIPCSVGGMFHRHRVAEMLDFVKQNPQYHIYSVLNGHLYFNRLILCADQFFLAKGDPDPEIGYIQQITLQDYHEYLVLIFWRREDFAELDAARRQC